MLDIDWDVYGAEALPAAPAAALDIAGLQALLAPIVGAARPDALDPDTPLLSLGIDSLMAVEFAQAIGRKLGRSVPRTFVYSHPTLRAATAALTRAPEKAAPVAASKPSGDGPLALLVPTWAPSATAAGAPGGWRVLGEGRRRMSCVVGCRPARMLSSCGAEALPASASLADWRLRRSELLSAFTAGLRSLLGTTGRFVWVTSEADPRADLLDGLIATLQAEHPELRARRIMVAAELQDAPAALQAELGRHDAEPLVLLRPAGRLVRRFEPAPEGRPAAPLHRDASYLVTGGAGGIGKLVVRHLLDSGAGRVVLASRRAAVDLTSVDADRISAVHCDLTDEHAVTALVDRLSRQGPPLRGVFHLAGVTADGLLATQDPLAMEPAFGAKLDGAWLLDRATRRLELDHFVLFGSVTAAIGLAGAGAYAAANAALDGIARGRQRAGLPGLSIGWAAWSGIGMAEATQLWRDSPMPSYAPAAALAALDRALQLPMPTVVVLSADATALLAWPERDRTG